MASNLGEFVKELAALMSDKHLQLPLKDERPWHSLFFDLKRDRQVAGRPAFFDRLVFDWDGASPRCQELSEFIHALHWNANVTASNPTYETLTLSDEVAARWRPTNVTGFHSTALDRATTKFRPAA
jgi:hypothetical protein